MEYSLIDKGAFKRVAFYGNIKPSSRPKFLEIAEHLPSSSQKKWVLDVHEFDYIDSAGLGMLIELHENAQQAGVSIAIEGANELVRKMFALSKFETLFEIID